MKIGILTYHKAHNYGALLQAVGLRTALQELGHEVYFVDFFPEYHKSIYKPLTWKKFWRTPHSKKIRYLLNFKYRKERIRNFNSFIAAEISPYCKSTDEQYDTIVYGSDQIWRKQDNTNGFNPVYFGKNNFATKKNISYAASMGIVSLTSFDKEQLRSYLSNFSYVSVREEQLCNELLNIGIKEVVTVIDPTFLISPVKWKQFIKKEIKYTKKYVLVYDLLNGSFDMKAIYEYAQKNDCDVITITGTASQIPTYQTRTTADPYDFLNLINNATTVFTSSFHGLAFSLIFEKEVYASFKKNSERGRNLLMMAGLEERLLPCSISTILETSKIDYQVVRSRLEVIKNSSLQFLKSAL